MDRGRVNLYLDKDDLKRLKVAARAQDTSLSRIIRQLVRKYLKKVKSRGK